MSLPTGMITFLFTDIEGSTRLWEERPEAMKVALARHDDTLRRTIEGRQGYVFKTVGDAFCAAFSSAASALAAALEAQRALLSADWGEVGALRVRMALHAGSADERGGDYFGPPVNRVARLLAIGHGGQVLVSGAAKALIGEALPPGASLRDMGQHRLKDLAQPMQVLHLCHESLPQEFPPLRSLSMLRHNLPVQVTSFIGRGKEIAAIKERLAGTHLLTLTGSGGVGKTRLALQAAAEMLEAYPEGVWLVELAPLSDPGLVPTAVAQALGMREEPGKDVAQTLARHLRSQRLCLVLDNCEHLLDACARLADHLLRSCPEVRMLATSREALGIAGESLYRVQSLSLPEASQPLLPENLNRYETVRLFAERARAVTPSFVLSRGNAPAVAQICRRLDGIPLAIELAAARSRVIPVEQIAHRLGDRFRLLTGGNRTALPRQQTLRALIDWSYDLLSPQEQTLLRRLSIFSGGWTMEAAEQVCAGEEIHDDEVLDLLTSLVDKSLVVYREPGMEEAGGGEARYLLLESIRQYAREGLAEAGGYEALRARHRDYFLALAEEAERQRMGPGQRGWNELLIAEHDNLRAALDECLADESGTAGEAALRFCCALRYFWWARGELSEGRKYFLAALAHPGAAARTIWRGRVMGAVAMFAYGAGEGMATRGLHEESLAIARELGDREVMGTAYLCLGALDFEQGEFGAARPHLEQGIRINHELGNRVREALCWSTSGLVSMHQGDFARAASEYDAGWNLAHEWGDVEGEAMAHIGKGFLDYFRGDFPAARARIEQALTIQRAGALQTWQPVALRCLGMVATMQGDYGGARAFLEQSLERSRAIGQRGHEGRSLASLGWMAARGGDPDEARRWLAQALRLLMRLGMQWELAYALEISAYLSARLDLGPRAARLYGAADALRRRLAAPMPPSERPDHDSAIAASREALGAEAFAATWEAGMGLSLDQAVEYALAQE